MSIIWDDAQSNIIWDDEKKKGEIMTPQTFKQKSFQKRIASRPDIYKQAVQEIQYAPEIIKQHPFQSPALPIDILLKSIGGVAQRGEAAIANPFIRTDTGFQSPTQAVKKGVTGQRLGEIGDIIEQAGIPRWTGIPAIGGLLATGIIGGSLAKLAQLGKTANTFSKIETTYGKDIGKNVIRWTTGMSDSAIEHGMKKGWKNVLTKENLNPVIPTQVAKQTLDNLTDLSIKQYNEYGKTINKVNTGFVKARDLLSSIEQKFVDKGYMTSEGVTTQRLRPKIADDVFEFYQTWKTHMTPDENIPIPFVQNVKEMVKKVIPSKYFIGKSRSLNEEQRFAKEMYDKLNELIGFNSYGIENKALTYAKHSYRNFKDFEARILGTFSETVGQQTLPTADKIVGVFDLPSTKAIEETNKLRQIDKFLVSKGYSSFIDRLFNWFTTQSAIVQPQKQGGSLYPFRLLAESVKYTTRQVLKTGVPSFIGKGISGTEKGISKIRVIGQKTRFVPAAMARTTREFKREK